MEFYSIEISHDVGGHTINCTQEISFVSDSRVGTAWWTDRQTDMYLRGHLSALLQSRFAKTPVDWLFMQCSTLRCFCTLWILYSPFSSFYENLKEKKRLQEYSPNCEHQARFVVSDSWVGFIGQIDRQTDTHIHT